LEACKKGVKYVLRKNREKGFTLVELIVVIAIVAVLAGVLMLAINPAALLAKSRDAKRLDDLEALNKAISLALADGEMVLGDATGTSAGSWAVDGTGWVSYTLPAGRTGLGKYLATLPGDPTYPDTTYVYTFASIDGVGDGGALAGYELNTVLESPDNASKMSTDGGDDTATYEVGTTLILLSPAP
jgi:prepilin-type N-terminal cleavage/methylation domain-containing protein